MDGGIFKKMKARTGSTALVINPPQSYPRGGAFSWEAAGAADFVHLFVQSESDFDKHFPAASAALNEGVLFWLSYPKASGKTKFGVNRDSLWDVVIPHGFHPVAQVSLDDKWSAIRLKPNEAGVVYARPERPR